ncbi:MAG TPA: hypothetical protein VII56_13180 [Rhizomicrobium sp.]
MGRGTISRRGLLLPLTLSVALLSFGAAPALAPRDGQDIETALKAYFAPRGMPLLRPTVRLAVNRKGAVESTDNTRCAMTGYTDSSVVEHPSIGYVPWIKWAEKNGIVEYQTVGTLNGAPWRCPFVVEQQVLTDYRMMWDGKPGLVIWLSMGGSWQFVGLKQSAVTVGGVPNVPAFDLTLDITATSQWPGITLTPSATHSTVRLIRDPKTGKMVVVKADLHMPTVKLEE